MTLSDGRSGQSLVDLRGLEFQQSRGSRIYRLDEATIDASQLAEVADTIDGWFAFVSPEVHEVQCRRLAIRLPAVVADGSKASSPEQFVLHHVEARIDRDAAGRVRAQAVGFTRDAQDPAHAVRLTLAPSTGSSVAKALTLETETTGIVASALAALVPGFGRYGDEAVFAGKAQWLIEIHECQGVVQGRVEQTELAGVLPASSPHRLRGRAAIDITEFRWNGARLERLAGAVISERAEMSRSLVDAAVTNFRCGRGGDGQPVADDPSLVAVDLLAVRFELNDEGLTFWGHCPPEAAMEEGCMAVSGRQPLLIAPRLENWHVGWLVQTLLAPPSGWLPATREAVELGERLPLPLK